MAFAKSPKMVAKIKSQATINLGTSVKIYNLKVLAPVLYTVALSELPWVSEVFLARFE